jgi:16S rRNA U516 pseudouridylate synthase RsuA-like enzyme
MAKRKRKLTPAEKAAKKRRRSEYMTVFVGGKQKRVKRPPTIDGMDVDEFIRMNADPIWLHQEGMWEYMDTTDEEEEESCQQHPPTDAEDGAVEG